MSHDPYILYGLHEIINPENIRNDIDLRELEKKIADGSGQDTSRDPTAILNAELAEAARRMNIDFGLPDLAPKASSAPTSPAPAPTQSYYDDSDDSQSEESDADDDPAPVRQDAPREGSAHYDNPSPPSAPFNTRGSSDFAARTREQQRREHINSALGGSGGGGGDFSFEREKTEDAKCSMLAEIDSLLGILSGYDVDISRVPTVDHMSSYDEIEKVLRLLRYKNDHARYCSFAEETMLFGAHLLEDLFDGKKVWLGKYRPDVTGWHNNVLAKLRRMRHDTGRVISGVMQDYEVSPMFRIALELVPSLFLHSRTRQLQHSEPDLYTDADYSAAQDEVRNI